MFKKLRKRTKEDKGNAVIILGLMLIMALLLVGGTLLDLSKAYQLKSSYVDAARKATQAAVMEQRPDGYLKPEAAGRAILTYENITRPAVVNKDGYFSKCEEYGDNDVTLRITFFREGSTGYFSRFNIPRSSISEDDTVESITSRFFSGYAATAINGGRYDGIQLEVTEGTENVILPGAFRMTQAEDGESANMKCQQMAIGAKANIFTGDSDKGYH